MPITKIVTVLNTMENKTDHFVTTVEGKDLAISWNDPDTSLRISDGADLKQIMPREQVMYISIS